MSAKLHQSQHLKTDSNVASFGGTVTTTVSAAEGGGLRSVEKNAVLTEHQLDEMYRRNNLHLDVAAGGSNASLISSGTGDTASQASGSAASGVSSGVSTDSAELLERHRQQQQLLQQQQILQQQLLAEQRKQQEREQLLKQQQEQQQQQQQRFASLLTVERGPPVWASHAYVTFRYRSERLYYLDSACRLHGPMDQRELCQVASVRRWSAHGSDQQPTVATRSHRAVQSEQVLHKQVLHQQQQPPPPPSGAQDDGLLLLDRRFINSSGYGRQQSVGGGGAGSGGVYSRVQVNQYDLDWSPGALPRSRSQQLEYGEGARGGGYLRQRSRESRQQQQQPQQQQHSYYHRSNYSSHHQQRHSRGPQQQQPPPPPPPPHPQPGFDARLEQLERSLNQAMESIRRQASQQRHRYHQEQHQERHQEQHQYLEESGSGGLRRFNSEPPFEFRYSQRTMTHEPPQVTEEVETTTLQPIGRGIHDLGGAARVTSVQQQQQQQHSYTEHRVSRAGRLTARQPPEPAGRSLSANRSATLRASTPVSPRLQQQQQPATARGRHQSANAYREFGQVY